MPDSTSNQGSVSVPLVGDAAVFTGTNAGALPANLRDALDLSAFRDINIRGTSQLADYNNGDRLLNMTLRYYSSTGWGAMKTQLAKLRDLPTPPRVGYLPRAVRASALAAEYEATTTVYFQLFKGRNSLATFNYNLMNPGLYGEGGSADYVMAVANAVRSGISAGVANVFAAANAVRYSPRMRAMEMITVTKGDVWDGAVLGEIHFEDARHIDFQKYQQTKATVDAVKRTRQYYNTAGFFLLGVSNAAGAGLNFWQASLEDSESGRARAGLSGGAQTALTLAMAFKSASAWYSATGRAAQATSSAKAGSAFGLLNGLLSFSSFIPTLADAKAPAELKAVTGAEMALQIIGAGLLTGGNYRLVQALQKGTSVTGAVGMMSLASLIAALNPTEIYRLVKQSEYADKLNEIARLFEPRGYSGDRLLSNFYDDKTAVEAGMMGANVTIALIGVAVDVAIATGAATSGVGVVVGLVLAAVGFGLSAIQQRAVEDMAEGLAREISAKGGGRVFFANNLAAVYELLVNSSEFVDALKDWQATAQVDSVVVGNSVTLTPTAVELAGVTRNGQRLSTALTRLERVMDGQIQQNRQVELDAAKGTIQLTAGTGAATPGTQMLTFYSPLMAPGVENRDRDKTGKNSYRTFVDLKLAEGGWKIEDDGTSTVFDLARVVSTFIGRDNKNKPVPAQRVPINVKAGGGDDTILPGASDTQVDGGAGIDVVSYAGMEQVAPLTLTTRADGAYVVSKDLAQVEAYVETEKTQKVVVGTRTENVEVRSVEVQVIKGSKGEDILSNVEMVIGGKGNDTFTGGSGTDFFAGGLGDDLLQGMDGDDVLEGGAGYDRLMGGAGVDAASYRSASKGVTVLLDVSRTIPAELPANLRQAAASLRQAATLTSLQGQERIGVAVDGDGGTDRLASIENVFGSRHDDLIVGDMGENLLRGEGGHDLLHGHGGDDVLDGGAGNDTLLGGAGDDTLVRGADGDGVASLDGGEGFDVVDYSSFVPRPPLGAGRVMFSGVWISLPERMAVLQARFSASSFITVAADTLVNIEAVVGSRGNDSIQGDSLANVLGGSEGEDTLLGGAGNDSLYGGSGNDQLQGDANDDLLAGGDGNDLLQGGDGDDILHGGEGLNVLDGGAGVDTASYVADPLLPFLFLLPADGNGIYADMAELVNGEVRVYHDLGADGRIGDRSRFDRLISVENIIGSGGNDILRGSAAGESLAGAGGNDRIEGRAGNDVLFGNEGNDTLIGGTGRDTLYGGSGEDLFLREDGDWGDVIDGGEDADIADYSALRQGGLLVVMSSGVVSLRATYLGGNVVLDRLNGIEGVIGTDADDDFTAHASGNIFDGKGGNDLMRGGAGSDMLFGGAGRDVLSGNGGDDTLYGGSGADVLEGGEGDDFLVQDGLDASSDIFRGGAGNDTLDYSQLDLTSQRGGAGIRADMQAGSVTKLYNGTSVTDLVEQVELLRGSMLNDTLLGSNGDDQLFGDDGDDILFGGRGNDYLGGGAGADSVSGGEGDDWVFGDTTSGGDTLDGGEGVNVLDYGSQPFTSSDDMRRAGLELDLGRGLAFKRWLSGEVYDRVSRFQSVLGTNLSDLMTGSDASETLRGGAGQDVLRGEAGDDSLVGDSDNDQIEGGAGNDTLVGGTGNDSLLGSAGSDVFVQTDMADLDALFGGEGKDIVDYSALYEEDDDKPGIMVDLRYGYAYKRANLVPIENVVGFGSRAPLPYADRLAGIEGVVGTVGADRLSGDAEDNWLAGGAGNDSLEGLDGADVLDGGAGDDTLLAGNGGDILAGGAGNDLLNGGTGDDVYRVWFDAQSKDADVVQEVVGESGEIDVLWFAGDARAEDLLFNRVGNDLVIFSGNSTVTVQGWWDAKGRPGSQVEVFLSSDGKMLSKDKIDNVLAISPPASQRGTNAAFQPNSAFRATLNKLWIDDPEGRTRSGSGAADVLYGGSGNDVVDGGPGADRLYGKAGDDVFLQDDLASADAIDGGAGFDTVVYTGLPADGGVAADLVSRTVRKRHGGSVVSTDSVQGIEGLVGTLFDDELAGDREDNFLEGGKGNDILRGRAGNDTYLFNPGFGNDILYEDGLAGDDDLLSFGEGIDPERLWFERRGSDLRIQVAGASDSISVPSWFSDPGKRTERIVAGGRILTSEQVAPLADLMTGYVAGASSGVAPMVPAGLLAAVNAAWRPLAS